tara:strand:- start:94 stop:399 length:306 start_codon:yes stop_codon:yes gene_type:complete
MTKKRIPFSDAELRDCINLYFRFLDADKQQINIGKNSNYKALAEKHNNCRPWGSYMYKCQNISSVMQSLGLPYAKGLKPAGNTGPKLRLLITGIAVERGLI